MIIFPLLVIDPCVHAWHFLTLFSSVTRSSPQKSGYSSTVIAFGGVGKSMVPPIGVFPIISSKDTFSSSELNANQPSLMEVPLTRSAWRLMLWVR